MNNEAELNPKQRVQIASRRFLVDAGTAQNKLLTTAIQVALVAISLASLSLIAVPGLALLVHPVKSRSPYCTLSAAITDASRKLKQDAEAGRILKNSRVVKKDGNLTLWETPLGLYWAPPGPNRILPTILAQQQRNIYGDETWGVHPGDIVLDCGAHVGTYTKKALAAGARLVVAIEPTPETVECLRRNLAAEIAAGRVIIYGKGVWDSEGVLTLFGDGGNGGAGNGFIHQDDSQPIEKIPVTTIDKLTEELKLARVDFIKTDIKGATERALAGAQFVISRYHPRLALSTEDDADDAKSIANLATRLLPQYKMKCGPCLVSGNEMYSDVLFFR
jgi:FkbM family methyltransferase